MATHLSKLKKRNGDIILPVTRSEGVILDDGSTDLQTKLDAIDYAIDNIDLSSKQDVLVSGSNIKTINNESLLGSSNIELATTATYTATLPYTSWTGSSAPFTKEVTVSGILSTDNPVIDIVQTGTYATDQAMVTNWALIYRAVASNGFITFYATAIPSADIPIQVKVVR